MSDQQQKEQMANKPNKLTQDEIILIIEALLALRASTNRLMKSTEVKDIKNIYDKRLIQITALQHKLTYNDNMELPL